MSPILLDTHAAIWSLEAALDKRAARAIIEAASREELLISPITAWEIGTLVRKRRLVLNVPVAEYVRGMFSRRGITTAPLTPAIAVAATNLPASLHGDPADRILVATAAAFGARLVTRDQRLLEYARSTRHILCIRC